MGEQAREHYRYYHGNNGMSQLDLSPGGLPDGRRIAMRTDADRRKLVQIGKGADEYIGNIRHLCSLPALYQIGGHSQARMGRFIRRAFHCWFPSALGACVRNSEQTLIEDRLP